MPAHAAALHRSPGFGCRQAEFARALLDPDRSAPQGLVGPDGLPSAKRFAVYRNNVVIGLIETLKAAFPVVRRLVGDEFFGAMARLYALEEPPTSPIMLDYGAGLPGFIRRFAPAAMLAYLEDVARLERAWVEAYHAAEAAPLPATALRGATPEQLPLSRLALHPSARIVSSPFPILSIWQANIEGGDAASVSLDEGAHDVLVARPEAEVELRLLPAGASAFMTALLADSTVIEATKEALGTSPRFDLAGTLRGMAEAGLIVGHSIRIDLPQEDA